MCFIEPKEIYAIHDHTIYPSDGSGWLAMCPSCSQLISAQVHDPDRPWALKLFTLHCSNGFTYPAAVVVANGEQIKLCDECADNWHQHPVNDSLPTGRTLGG